MCMLVWIIRCFSLFCSLDIEIVGRVWCRNWGIPDGVGLLSGGVVFGIAIMQLMVISGMAKLNSCGNQHILRDCGLHLWYE